MKRAFTRKRKIKGVRPSNGTKMVATHKLDDKKSPTLESQYFPRQGIISTSRNTIRKTIYLS